MSSRYGQLVIGPAGVGKTTWISTVQEHYATLNKRVCVVNMDPALDDFTMSKTICTPGTDQPMSALKKELDTSIPINNSGCPIDIDVRQVVDVDQVMKELNLGPNGALMASAEHIVLHERQWLIDEIISHNCDYFLFDFPGQIELYLHSDYIDKLVKILKQDLDFQLTIVYVIDVNYIASGKFHSMVLSILSSIILLALPAVGVISKCDRCTDQELMNILFNTEEEDDSSLILDLINYSIHKDHLINQYSIPNKYNSVIQRLLSVAEEYAVLEGIAVDIRDSDTIAHAVLNINMAMNYGEEVDFKLMRDD